MNVIVVGSTYEQAKKKLFKIAPIDGFVRIDNEICSVYNKEVCYKSYSIESISLIRGECADILYVTKEITCNDLMLIKAIVSHGREVDVIFY